MTRITSRQEPDLAEYERLVVFAAGRLQELHECLKALSDMVGRLDPVTLALRQYDITDLIDRLAARAKED